MSQKPSSSRQAITALAALMALTVSCAPPAPGVPGNFANRGGKTVLAIYMLGSDLEDDVDPRNKIPDEQEKPGLATAGAGQSDFKELIAGYQQLNEAQKANVDVFVAFGGARKQGWKGITYVDMPTLLRDAEDGYIGNLPAGYLFRDEQANMGDTAVFQRFLERVKTRNQGAATTLLELWDHGASYQGLGPDTNHPGDKLNLPEMSAAFKASGFKSDVIGFDACLMASIEVARAVQDHADYLVASEELEPGHGWDYTPIVNFVGQNAGVHPQGLSRYLVDQFITSPNHQTSKGKTLSVIDLKLLKAVFSSIDGISSQLEGDFDGAYAALLTATSSARRFGVVKGPAGTTETSVDLLDFADKVKGEVNGAAGSAEALKAALKAAVVYNRTDDTIADAHGLSIFSLNNANNPTRKGYQETNAATPTWFGLVSRFGDFGTADTTPPTITGEKAGELNGEAGVYMTVRDNKGLKDIFSIRAVFSKDGNKMKVLGAVPLEPLAEGNDKFFNPDWDGSALHVASGPVSASNGVTLALEVNDVHDDGTIEYTTLAQLNHEEVVLTVLWDPHTNRVTDAWATPFQIGENGDITFDREQYSIEQGDTLTPVYEVIDLAKDETAYEDGPTITFTQAPQWGLAPAAGIKAYFVFAEDLKGNVQNSEPHEVE